MRTPPNRTTIVPHTAWLPVLVALLLGACRSTGIPAATCNAPQGGTSLNAWDEDLTRKSDLERTGVCRAGREVVAWFPGRVETESRPLSEAEMGGIVAKLDRGIHAAKAFIGAPDWSFRGDRRVYFYFPDANFISHAPGGNTAFIPFWRIREDKAPWIHEAMHLIIRVDGDWLSQPDGVAEADMPLWLHEGMAESIAMEVAEEAGLVHFSPLIDVPATELDRLAADRISACPDPQRVLSYVGGRGKLPELFGEDRMRYAAAFYAASSSFVRHLARRDGGYGRLLVAIRAFAHEHAEYERLSGRPIDVLRREWMSEIGLDAANLSSSRVP